MRFSLPSATSRSKSVQRDAPLLKSIFILIFTLASFRAAAAIVAEEVDGSVILEDVDSSINPGDLYYTVDSLNVRRGVVQILSVEPPVGKAKLLIGETTAGFNLSFRSKASQNQRRFTKSRVIKRPDGTNAVEEAYDPSKKIRIGGGITYFNFRGNFAGSSPSYVQGYALGIYYGFWTSRAVSIEPGLLYYQTGGAFNSNYSYSTKLNYISIPVLLKFAPKSSDADELRILTGVSISYLAGSSSTFNYLGTTTAKSDITDSKLDSLFIIGTEYITQPGGWWVDFTFNVGLVNIAGSQSGGAVYNQGFMLTAGGSL
jgi:hypothetical protein